MLEGGRTSRSHLCHSQSLPSLLDREHAWAWTVKLGPQIILSEGTASSSHSGHSVLFCAADSTGGFRIGTSTGPDIFPAKLGLCFMNMYTCQYGSLFPISKNDRQQGWTNPLPPHPCHTHLLTSTMPKPGCPAIRPKTFFPPLAMQQSLWNSIVNGNFIDAKIFAFSRRSRTLGRVDTPKALFVNTHVLATACSYFESSTFLPFLGGN